MNPRISFKSPINSDNGYTVNRLVEETESTLELFGENGDYTIEWDIPELGMTEHIGIYCWNNDKVISDYDGVFEVPQEAIKFLEDNGFDCTYLKE